MSSRHRSRERALQILYQWDVRRQPVEEAIEAYFGSLEAEDGETKPERDPFTEELVRGVAEQADKLDYRISQHSEHWRLDRMSVVDRNILRLAVYEMMHLGTPAPVVIDEALRLARRFSGEEAGAFVNGVLDAVWRGLAAAENGPGDRAASSSRQ